MENNQPQQNQPDQKPNNPRQPKPLPPQSQVPPEQPPTGTPPTEPPPEQMTPQPEEQPLDQTPAQITPTQPQPDKEPSEKVALPGPEDEADLDEEVAEALGDVSLMDLYHLEEPVSVKAQKPAEKTATEKPSQIKRGKVIGISGDDIFVDMGGKSQGLLPRQELEENEKVEVGSEVDVVIISYDSKDGLLILSKKTAEQQLLLHNLKEGSLVEARVVGDNKGGLEMDIKGIEAFMPISQVDLARVEDLKPFVGQKFVCEVVEVEKGDKNIVLSRKNVLIKERQERQDQLWEELEKGQTHHGVVQSIADYGAFVDLGGVDGLLHVSELSWTRVKSPKEILQVGQEIDVVIIEIDKNKRRMSLSLRQAGGDPWTSVEVNYPVGSRHKVQIRNLQDFGAFAELEPGVEGLIPISEMTWAGRIRHPRDVVEAGALVEAEILTVDTEKRRIALSMKRIEENPWANVEKKYFKEQLYKGQVARVAEFGAFVTLEPGVDGLVHISEMSDQHIKSARDVVTVGDEITVKILSIDKENQRISLTLKGIAPIIEEEPPDPEKKKKDRPHRGGLSADQGDGWMDLGHLKM
ncbi:S1 RNA-binding domain-containing protein [Planctomycetota bacterium]